MPVYREETQLLQENSWNHHPHLPQYSLYNTNNTCVTCFTLKEETYEQEMNGKVLENKWQVVAGTLHSKIPK